MPRAARCGAWHGWEGVGMDARELVRSLAIMTVGNRVRGLRDALRTRRLDARFLPDRGGERARMPGSVEGAEPMPGGGLIRFTRSSLRVRVAVGGAVFCGWDGAEPEPSYALAEGCPPADIRATLEPDKEGGWRVVSERVLVVVTTHGAVEFRTPGGVLLRREQPPRWWDVPQGAGGREAEEGRAGARWVQRA